MSEKCYYHVIFRVRDKVEQLEEDLKALDEDHDTLGDELRDIVCDDTAG